MSDTLIFALFNVINSLTFGTCYYLFIQEDLLSSYCVSGALKNTVLMLMEESGEG